ncbi:hypothetical protein MMC17_001586 [Xylographa soralifera]|nr:hypothetical protein [Xylographa soralifera]
MSSSAQGGPGASGADKQPGFSRFMRRASKVLRSSSNRTSVAGASELTAPPPATAPASKPALSKASTASRPQQVKKMPMQPAELAVPGVPISAAAYNKQQEEKARALFAKYGMTLEPGEWTPVWRGDAGRVEKHVRLRVHRQCHRCQTTFGPEKICNNCSHTRCKKCPRFPTKSAKDPEVKDAAAATTPMAASGAPVPNTRMRTKSLTLPEQLVGNELIRRTPMHRVRRMCHKCNTVFAGKATECTSCKHLRCPRCPREPPKLHKFPNGYPGDTIETYPLAERTLRPIRTRIRYQCHECKKMFLEHEKVCGSCKHGRCEQCLRQPPKKMKPEPAPEVLRSVEQRIARMQLET